ncbi:DNA-binding XRE family transcriptional regulator [Clostridium tetanomorphum]|nr:DNA-binding XRE family transcriptional regulator [Clostridium tetanomorphum]
MLGDLEMVRLKTKVKEYRENAGMKQSELYSIRQ